MSDTLLQQNALYSLFVSYNRAICTSHNDHTTIICMKRDIIDRGFSEPHFQFNSIQSYCFAHHLSFLSISMLMLMRWCHNYSCHCYCCFLYFLVTLLISVNVTVLRSCQLLIIPFYFYFFKLVVIARKAQMHRHSHITTAHVISTAPHVIFMHFS